ncbi:hypothetical protein ABVT39_026772 [Epinephelus coioides]
MTEESAVKVCIRVRPLIAREESAESEDAEPVHLFWKADKKSIHQIDDGNSTKSFSFDRVFTAEETTNQLYQNIAKPLVVSTVEGYNGTIFAYGQTSSGKTFTMMGSDRSPGVIPLAVEDVFQTIKNCPKKEFLLRVSYMEIYNETVTDLLVDSWKRKPLEVRETINKNIYVADLTEELVTSPAQALAWIRKGEKNRHYGKTKMNQRSSRSHTIFRMILESRERSDPASGENADGAIIVSHLNLVDLAGSERASQTGAEGTRFKEGCNINRSLFTLGQVIKKLTDESQKGFTNYRDSKLTRILQNSLGGNAKTVIIGTITPVALDETLSTLQFASTAKKMKNDPHVTEVSDDGALLKRYRNEIVDLKRRLHEVSSVTQTTATEKEVLSQLLQEKDQLQREQEDRIRNLTKLLVTSTNQVPAQKMPKRRVTWGGKMLRLARPSACDGGSSDLSFADPFTRKRKASNVSLMELVEDDEDFDSHWEIPDEPSDDMEISQSSVTVRSFGDSPKDFVSPDRMHELSGKVSSLQLQLQTEVQQKQEALEKVAMLDLRVADLERRLEEQNNTPSKTDEQMGKQFAEAIQLCETLASEKDVVEVERDYLKQELGMFLEQIETLEKEKAALSKEMEEKREMDEFKALEEEFRKEQEIQRLTEELESMRAERDSLLSGKEPSCQTSTEEMEKLLCRVTSLTEERDQLQEILEGLRQEKQQLRAELEDRMEMMQCELQQQLSSEPQSLKEEQEAQRLLQNQQLEEHLEKTEEVSQLKSDLQENVELMIEVQEELRESQEKIRVLKDEINVLKSQKAELEGKASNGSDADISLQMQELQTQIQRLTEELESMRAERDSLLSGKEASCQTSTEEMEKLLCRVTSLTEERDQLQEILEGLRQEKQQLRAELEDRMEMVAQVHCGFNQPEGLGSELHQQDAQVTHLQQEIEQLQATLQAVSEQKSQLEVDLQHNMEMAAETQSLLHSLQQELQEQNQRNADLERLIQERQAQLEQEVARTQSLLHSLEDEHQELKQNNSDHMKLCEQKESDLEQQIAQLNMSLQAVTEQKRQVEYDLQQNMNMASTTQELLKSVQEELCEQKQMNSDLEKLCQEKESSFDQQVRTLTEKLESIEAERDSLFSEKEASCQTSTEEMEKLLCRVTSLSEERDQLQEALEGLRQEKQQLRAELEDRMERMQCELQQQLTSEPQSLKEEQEAQTLLQIQQLEEHLEKTKEEVSQLKSDLQENVELMIENQEELRESQEKIRVLKDEISVLKSQKAELEGKASNGSDADISLQVQELQTQIQRLTEELESVRAERDGLLSGKESSCQTSTEEMEKLLCRVTSLTEERDQLQEILEGLRQEKQQLRAELEDRIETMQTEVRTLTEKLKSIEAERDSLLSEKEASCQTSTEEMEKLLCRVTCLTEERDQLQEILEGLRQEKQQLRAELEDRMETMQTEIAQLNMSLQTVTEQKRQVENDLQQNMNMASTTQELLKSVQEELCEQKQMNSDLEKLCQEKESSFDQQVRTLTEKLESIEAERDSLLSEKEASCQTSTEEMEKLLCRVTSLSEERDQLQEALEGLRREKQQLKAELEDRMEMISGIQERLSEQENLNSQQQPERGEQETKLQRRVQQLEEQLQTYRERHSHAEAEAETSQQLLSEAKTTISALKEQLSSLEQSTSRVKETASSRLQDSTGQLQESFRKFQHLIDTCSKYNSTALDKVQCSLKHPYLASLPKPTMNAYSTVCQLQVQTTQSLGNIMEHLQVRAQGYRNLFEELVKKDLAVFEERRLQDVLLCRAQAPCYSVRDEDFHTLWHHRLTELLNKRELYLQKMASISSTLCANMASYPSELSAEIRHRERFKEQLQTLLNKQPFSLSGLDSILSSELDHRSAVAHNRKMILQGIIDEQNGLFEELKLLEAQADLQFREERSKSSTLLQALEGAPLKTELSLLKDNQQLVLQLQQTEEQVEALRVHNKQLEEAQIKANNRVSNHKQATQLLQTELQDTRAQVEDKDDAIQALRSKLRESEKNASPSAVELEKLRTKLFKMEVELSSASDNHKKEIQQMTTLMNQKEESLRKLKETLRKSQQEGEESFLQGEDLHARLTNPRGLVIKSSVVLEKTKLEEEVKQLQLKITELESLVSSQQVEINKWKSRAFKLKVKSKAEVDRPPSPCTPTKRGLPLTSDPSNFLSSPKKFLVTPRKVLDSPRKVLDSPRKLLDSPKVSVLDSPKSRFFDVGGSSEVLSRTCPKQFFDNSSLGTIPEVFDVPEEPDADMDAAAGADRKDWWPQSPKQEEMCKTQ